MATKQQRKFRSLVGKWKQRLWLREWYVDFDYVDTLGDDGNKWQTTASVASKPQYRHALVTVAEDGVKEMSDVNMNRTACHEMVHVALSAYDNMCVEMMSTLPVKAADAFERWRWNEHESVTETLTSILLDAYKEKQSE